MALTGSVMVGNVLVLARKELRDAARNRWVWLHAGSFAALALALAWLGLTSFLGSGVAGLGRTGASLIHLVLLLVPLIGLTLGAVAVAGERERGTLAFLLAQPVTPGEVLLGKFLGLGAALLAALALGFGGAAAVIAWQAGGGDVGAYLGLLGLAALLALASLSVGLLVSCLCRTGAAATGIALFLWLVLVFLGDLGLMGTSILLRLDVDQLLALALVNPLQVFKIAAVMAIRGGAESLGPAGVFVSREYGGVIRPALAAILVCWSVAPLAFAGFALRRRGAV